VSGETANRRIQAELDRLAAAGLLTADQRSRIGERYPTGPVDLAALARWFTLLGAVAMAAGIVLLVHERAGLWLVLEGGLALAAAGLLAAGWYLGRRRAMEKTGAALELLGAMALQGLVVTLAIHHSTGSKNWPALVGILTALGLALAYALPSRLVLVLAVVEAFVWFGGSTGYDSGWGAWWLGMTYPVRFLAAGLVALGVAWLHATRAPPRWQGLARVWAHAGMLDLHLALWFLAVFGWFEAEVRWDGTEGERLLFSAAWAAVSFGCVALASRTGLRLLRGYGLTFVLVNLYTFYFQFVAARSPDGWFVHLLVLGGGLVGGGMLLERKLAAAPGPARPAA
jgi:hypothetical protein